MNTISKKVFAITNVSGTKILTDIAWIGLYLSDQKTTDKVTAELYASIPMNALDYMFERRSDNDDHIQYYKTFERAVEAVYEVSNRSTKPVTEPLAIVTISIEVSAEVTTEFNFTPAVDTSHLEEFEKAASVQLNCKATSIKQCRNSDLTGYNYPAFQKAYEAWNLFNSALIQE